MAARRVTPRLVHWLSGVLTSVALVAAVTGATALLLPRVPVLSMRVMYILVVLPVAVRWGTLLAALAAVLSMVTYNYMFLTPLHTFRVADSRNAVAIGVFLVTAVVVGEIAARSRREARALALLSAEQAALRRVATLVARSAPPSVVFEAVTAEVVQLLAVDVTVLVRFQPDATVVFLAGTGGGTRPPMDGPVGAPEALSRLLDTGRPLRIDNVSDASGMTALLGADDIVTVVCCPIRIEGRVWGTMVAGSCTGPLPTDIEQRLERFGELVATAVANAESRAELMASRARVVMTADETRRKLERDLHDGAQQRLISLVLDLRLMESSVPEDLTELRDGIGKIGNELTGVLEELRELSRGIHPAFLFQGGIGPALRTLARRSAVPVDVHVGTHRRYPERVEVAAFYVVSEALTNVAKHAGASRAEVVVDERDDTFRLRVCDDGVGGAALTSGTGLVGLRDRVEGLGGTLGISSLPGKGTVIEASLPLAEIS